MTAAISSELKMMLNIGQQGASQHQPSMERLKKDYESILSVKAPVLCDPFQSNSNHMIKVAIGEQADKNVQDELLRVKKIGPNALKQILSDRIKEKGGQN